MTPRTRLGSALTCLGLFVLVAFSGGCESKTDVPAKTVNAADAKRAEADLAARETASQNTAPKTPMDQSNSSASIRVTADIRRAILDDKSMSVNAQNCKVITDEAGVVTLRGPVDNQLEKDSIEAKARRVAGVSSVVNELEVRQN